VHGDGEGCADAIAREALRVRGTLPDCEADGESALRETL